MTGLGPLLPDIVEKVAGWQIGDQFEQLCFKISEHVETIMHLSRPSEYNISTEKCSPILQHHRPFSIIRRRSFYQLVAGRSHTVIPGCNPGALSPTGSTRTRNVLRSWSPTTRAARQVANSPREIISVTRALMASPPLADMSRTGDPSRSSPNWSSRRLKL